MVSAKPLFRTVLALVFALTLAGCGSSSSDGELPGVPTTPSRPAGSDVRIPSHLSDGFLAGNEDRDGSGTADSREVASLLSGECFILDREAEVCTVLSADEVRAVFNELAADGTQGVLVSSGADGWSFFATARAGFSVGAFSILENSGRELARLAELYQSEPIGDPCADPQITCLPASTELPR